ncbi:hypothetical protein BDV26DRAFT_276445 [Aspergillus bertholletiae]|uniref:Uncharacterized protein n=1 Tax=Aspergillus bertholletiae TaxID=1226010 RepID=A0A5N7AN36_9EURO|nr:hypothetical protein BDV26DRAFT_276445 [Aspergillus bertholletiae]
MDFVNRQRDLRLKRFESPTVLLATLELCNSYLTVLARGESLAQYLGANLFCNFLEEKFSALLSPNPSFSNQGIEERTKGFGWLNIIRHLDVSQLEDNGDGIYRCSIQGNIVEVSEVGYQMLKSGILQQFIEPWLIKGDIQKELEANEQTIAEASKWYAFALKGTIDTVM